MDKLAIKCKQVFFSRSENVFHTLSLCSLEGRFLVEGHKTLFLEDNKDDFTYFNGLPYPQVDYISPIQQWIERTCSGACHSWHEFDVLDDLHDVLSNFSLVLMEILAYDYYMFHVSLFCLMIEYKGRCHGIGEVLA
jgi:hypothetical protein